MILILQFLKNNAGYVALTCMNPATVTAISFNLFIIYSLFFTVSLMYSKVFLSHMQDSLGQVLYSLRESDHSLLYVIVPKQYLQACACAYLYVFVCISACIYTHSHMHHIFYFAILKQFICNNRKEES